MTGFAVTTIPTIAVAYAIDSYKPISGEIMVCIKQFRPWIRLESHCLHSYDSCNIVIFIKDTIYAISCFILLQLAQLSKDHELFQFVRSLTPRI
jgi:hypothetical protein